MHNTKVGGDVDLGIMAGLLILHNSDMTAVTTNMINIGFLALVAGLGLKGVADVDTAGKGSSQGGAGDGVQIRTLPRFYIQTEYRCRQPHVLNPTAIQLRERARPGWMPCLEDDLLLPS